MKLEQAQKIAESLIADLKPFCHRVEIGGSIRREKPDVKDIELVVIPKFGDYPTGQMSLEGDPLTSYENLLFEHIAANREEYRIIKMGVKYAQIHKSGMMIDVFTATPETWGYIFLLRTGPAEFSKWVVTELKKRGYIPKNGALWLEDSLGLVQCNTSSEHDVFRMLGIDWIEPEYRFKDVMWK